MTDITIITVVKNNLIGIKKTIASIKAQSFTNYEHIIIDSNSSDGTSEFVKENLNFQTFYLRESDYSIYDAINKGINLAKGNHIGILHSGDLFFSDTSLEKIIDNLVGYDYLFGDIVFFKNKKINRIWKFTSPNNKNPDPFKIPHTSLFIKKNIIKELGSYNLNYRISSDTDFLIKLTKKNFRYKKLNDYLVFMESGGVSFSLSNYFIKFKEDISILFKNYNLFTFIYYPYKILIKLNGFFLFFYYKELHKLKKKLKDIQRV